MPASNNSVKDMLGWYYQQAATTTADLQAVLLKKAGVQADDVLSDHPTLGSLLAASNDEADFTGPSGGNYVRKTIATPTRTVVNAADRVHLGGAAVGVPYVLTWSAAGGTTQNELGRLLVCFVPNPGTSTDADIIWLDSHDISAITDGNDMAITFHVDGAVRYRSP